MHERGGLKPPQENDLIIFNYMEWAQGLKGAQEEGTDWGEILIDRNLPQTLSVGGTTRFDEIYVDPWEGLTIHCEMPPLSHEKGRKVLAFGT
ncbi:hypothetical protein JTE90_003949 [Oedothorax gibbosus]|uniref:Uncharacterized protein n=1 Tax=Oedothorax gibbosus TaxID=931172 RepID=A0AAV6UY96_9ARAC|nr:hypothetical protein JTE90_003949 [Oedothorax gibbosus]